MTFRSPAALLRLGASLLVLIFVAIGLRFNILGKVVDIGTEEVPRHVFYNNLRLLPKAQYSESCYPKSEVLPVLPGQVCCQGLQQVGVIDSAQEGCNFVSGVALCTSCGNGLCEYGENECNCAEDCNAPEKRL